MEIEVNKSYHLNIPSWGRDIKVHIDYILDNPKDDSNSDAFKLVVYRIWSKHKMCWYYYINKYYVLAIYNDWKYGHLINTEV